MVCDGVPEVVLDPGQHLGAGLWEFVQALIAAQQKNPRG